MTTMTTMNKTTDNSQEKQSVSVDSEIHLHLSAGLG